MHVAIASRFTSSVHGTSTVALAAALALTACGDAGAGTMSTDGASATEGASASTSMTDGSASASASASTGSGTTAGTTAASTSASTSAGPSTDASASTTEGPTSTTTTASTTTPDTVSGTAATTSATSSTTGTTGTTGALCVDDDGECPDGCAPGDDNDCAPACPPGVPDPVQVSVEARARLPMIAMSDADTYAIVWQRYFSTSTSYSALRLMDRETLAPVTEEKIVDGGPLKITSSIRVISTAPAPGFVMSALRKDYTFGDTWCGARRFDPIGDDQGSVYNVSGNSCASPTLARRESGGYGYALLDNGLKLRRLEDNLAMISYHSVDVDAWSDAAAAHNPLTDKYVFVYSAAIDGDEEVVSARTTENGNVLASKQQISDGEGQSRGAEIVWNGEGFGVVWDDWRGDGVKTYFAALDGDGAFVQGDVQVIDNGYGARIAWSPEHQVYGIVWRSSDDEIVLWSLDKTGAHVGEPVVLDAFIPAITRNPAVTWDGERFAVVWHNNTDGAQTEQVFLTRVCPPA